MATCADISSLVTWLDGRLSPIGTLVSGMQALEKKVAENSICLATLKVRMDQLSSCLDDTSLLVDQLSNPSHEFEDQTGAASQVAQSPNLFTSLASRVDVLENEMRYPPPNFPLVRELSERVHVLEEVVKKLRTDNCLQPSFPVACPPTRYRPRSWPAGLRSPFSLAPPLTLPLKSRRHLRGRSPASASLEIPIFFPNPSSTSSTPPVPSLSPSSSSPALRPSARSRRPSLVNRPLLLPSRSRPLETLD